MANHIPYVVTLEDVEAEISAPSRRMTFSPAIDLVFNQETRDSRIRDMIWTAVAAVILYDFFLINDWFVLRDRFPEMVIARLLIFTPLMLAIMMIGWKTKSINNAEWLAAGASIVAVALPMFVQIYSNSPHKLSYQYGSLLVMMFATIVQRVRFWVSVVTLTGILVVQFTTTYLSHTFVPQTYVANVTFFGTAAILQLIALFILERSERRSFLLALRGRMLHQQLLLSARTDALTGLYNRRYLANVCDDIWSEPDAKPVSAILLDVDYFKIFNDSYGHMRGDECLQTVSACIRRALPSGIDLAFRFGGEEMLVLLPATEVGAAEAIAEAIREEIAAESIPHPAIGQGAVVTASFGLAAVTAPTAPSSALLAAADAALYAAKRAGRDIVWTHRDATPSSNDSAHRLYA